MLWKAEIAKQPEVKTEKKKKERKIEEREIKCYFYNGWFTVILLEMNLWTVGMNQIIHQIHYGCY